MYSVERRLLKSPIGNRVVFEEENSSLGLRFVYSWDLSRNFGFVRSSFLSNAGEECRVDILDGLRNILPAPARAGPAVYGIEFLLLKFMAVGVIDDSKDRDRAGCEAKVCFEAALGDEVESARAELLLEVFQVVLFGVVDDDQIVAFASVGASGKV